MGLKHILQEFISEMVQPYDKTPDNWRDLNGQDRFDYNYDYYSDDRYSRYGGISFMAILPQIAGFLLGCAIAKITDGDVIDYIVWGIVFMFIIGVLKSNGYDGYPLMQAIRMNIVMTVIICTVLSVFWLIYGNV